MNRYPTGFAVIVGCMKLTFEQDFNRTSEKEVLSLAKAYASGRVQR